jgi:hypothetical protein
MLRTSATAHLSTEFGFPVARAEEAVRLLIRHRQNLYLLRRLTREIQTKASPKAAELARTAYAVIAVLSRCLFRAQNNAIERMRDNLEELPSLLKSGEWLRLLLQASGAHPDSVTSDERWRLEPYLADPEGFTSEAFLFDETEFDITEWIGLFPPEAFTFVAPTV